VTRPDATPRTRSLPSLRDQLIVALDAPDLATALRHVDRLGDSILWYKVGLQLFCASGRQAVAALAERGKQIFLDLKLHDIPTTVERAILALEGLPVSLLTVHASGGPKMLAAAAAAAGSLAASPRVLGVTMLTSLDGTEIPPLWNAETSLEEKVLALARLAARSGVAGVVASPLELKPLRREHPSPFLIVTPGVRGPADASHDQKRTLSLAEALAGGADYVVVGRPILEATDPNAVLASYEAAVSAPFSTERNDR
jgi:orotidine-5'-phosphate decarboxylase